MAPPPKPWPTGISEPLGPLVTRVLAPNPSHFTYTGTQTYLVGGPGGLAVIDPGPADAAHLAALERAIGEARVSAICCTHTHRDHSPAAAPLAERTGAPVIGCAPLAVAGDALGTEAPFDASYTPDIVLTDGERVTGEGWTLEAVHTPGHTSNHLCFALPEAGALFTGDHVMGWSTTVIVPPDGDMGEYIVSLERLAERSDRVYYPAHGPPVETPQRLVTKLIGHRRMRERQVLGLLEPGAKRVDELVPAMYGGIDRALWPAAGLSVRAHLIELERRGKVAYSGDLWTIRA